MFNKSNIGHNEPKMGREEQIEEREVLDSIFPEEITGEVNSLRQIVLVMG